MSHCGGESRQIFFLEVANSSRPLRLACNLICRSRVRSFGKGVVGVSFIYLNITLEEMLSWG